ALGAAINLSHDWKGVFSHVYLGPGYSEDEIRAVLEEYKLSYSETANIEERVAGLLAQENLVGWFQGRMEVGPRALGNRTILANPINPDAKDRVNQYVKFREAWRPFAPSILQEAKEDYLVGAADSPYMILSFDVPTNAQPKIPGVLHVDGTVRAQTVAKDANPRYWNMIKAFEAKTGVPVVINTSYNIKGEPIVCTPRDAIRTFFSCGLDYLAIGNFLVSKK
ncbi:MAG: carbamoyltransferase, partial [Nanoarchaeota archaeon]|nr:carbamoyltransferase [Nanoarchaeota archaeon]